MELRQLEYFLAVAEEGSFTRGAARAHIVQSAASAAVQKLEHDLGARLFERDGHRITLTAAGEVLVPRARATLAAARAARDAVDEVRGGLRGTVTVGTMLSTATVDLPLVLGEFHRAHPLVSVRLRAGGGGSGGHLQALLDGVLDLALVSVPGPAPAGVVLRPLIDEPLRLVHRPGHLRSPVGPVALGQLAGETFIDFPPAWAIRAVVDDAFARAGLERTAPFEVSDYASALGMVRHGLGVVFLPLSAIGAVPDLAVSEIVGDPLRLPVSVARATGRPPTAAARALLTTLTSRCAAVLWGVVEEAPTEVR